MGDAATALRHSAGAPATEESLLVYERFLAALGMTVEQESPAFPSPYNDVQGRLLLNGRCCNSAALHAA
jgi:hypothetical protein